jgi:25S rRNA (uracil2843-N3)-methyltransferase
MSKYVRQEKSQRKHPIISSSTSTIKAPVVPTTPKERPRWKGPGFTRKAVKPPPRPTPASAAPTGPHLQQNLLSVELQQLLLNVFRTTFPICQDYETLKLTLREIKNALDEGDTERAFGRLDWMKAYVVRWSPSRALCYAAVLAGVFDDFGEEVWIKSLLDGLESEVRGFSKSSGATSRPLKAVCFGGAAAEIMAFGAVLRHFIATRLASVSGSTSSPSELELSHPILELQLVNTANWTPIISSLRSGLTTPPTLSKYASVSARVNNAPFLTSDNLKPSFRQCRVLEANQEELDNMIGEEAALVTLFFTLGDFLASSVVKCTAFLLKLTLAAPKNSLVLIIDRLDSSAEITVEKDDQGKERKTYPMHYLLDMVLLEKQLPSSVDKKPTWEKLSEDQSKLFRVAEELKYPIGLENIKFQFPLFNKL